MARGYKDGARVTALARAGAEAALVADRALDDGVLASALAVYREAGLCFMAAAVASTASAEPEAELPPATVLARFRERPWPGEKGRALEAFYALIERTGERPVGSPPARADVEAVRDVVSWLASLVEARGLGELRVQRAVRVALAACAGLVLLAWAISGLAGKKNVAFHKPVTASSLYNASVTPGGLTDGVIEGAFYGIHTKVGGSQWVQVDLESVYAIDKIDIYNRGDGYFDEGLPFVLQLSEDGVTFTDIDRRTTTFTQTTPWVVNAGGRRARYVRVAGAPGKYVSLSELEVYAK
ncbi:MAG TPA: discoidin domain-containing protein [Polyangia bacterium]|nr:discoidin domain-containing protein [Polyangia bacterium]